MTSDTIRLRTAGRTAGRPLTAAPNRTPFSRSIGVVSQPRQARLLSTVHALWDTSNSTRGPPVASGGPSSLLSMVRHAHRVTSRDTPRGAKEARQDAEVEARRCSGAHGRSREHSRDSGWRASPLGEVFGQAQVDHRCRVTATHPSRLRLPGERLQLARRTSSLPTGRR
jgi:hypothetical protein